MTPRETVAQATAAYRAALVRADRVLAPGSRATALDGWNVRREVDEAREALIAAELALERDLFDRAEASARDVGAGVVPPRG